MGSFDGAEVCELVGCYLLHQLPVSYRRNFGLYRDDGLGTIKGTARQVEIIKKEICNIFKTNGLRITADANKLSTNFLDITLDLQTGTHKPYSKPNNQLSYVHSRSNHPRTIVNNIPKAVNKRLCELSSSKEIFDIASGEYQQALEKSGYTHKLTFSQTNTTPRRTRQRHRNITWFNPPYSMNVQTNIGKSFLKIVSTIFNTRHKLYKIFNKNTLKISYSCMRNMRSIIKSHNKATLTNTNIHVPDHRCNCRNKESCPLPGKCTTPCVIYQATVTRNDNGNNQTYVGLSEPSFKLRYANHLTSFRNTNKRNATELSKYIWYLKDNHINYNIKWTILKRARPLNNSSGKCGLCMWEKFYIMFKPSMASLNKRSELTSMCRHATKFLLKNQS